MGCHLPRIKLYRRSTEAEMSPLCKPTSTAKVKYRCITHAQADIRIGNCTAVCNVLANKVQRKGGITWLVSKISCMSYGGS